MQYKIGDIVQGRVTGVQPYGAFVSLDSENSGLIHISEISSGFVKDVQKMFTIGEVVEARIIDEDVEHHHYKLSIKVLKVNTPRYRQRTARRDRLPAMSIGFQTLKDHLEDWIRIANTMEEQND
ncbi:MAG: CvfD/Ygs/GSP13 family RNA-binding post-transcriptional regulator [Erysipelotrichaceae bacterium]